MLLDSVSFFFHRQAGVKKILDAVFTEYNSYLQAIHPALPIWKGDLPATQRFCCYDFRPTRTLLVKSIVSYYNEYTLILLRSQVSGMTSIEGYPSLRMNIQGRFFLAASAPLNHILSILRISHKSPKHGKFRNPEDVLAEAFREATCQELEGESWMVMESSVRAKLL